MFGLVWTELVARFRRSSLASFTAFINLNPLNAKTAGECVITGGSIVQWYAIEYMPAIDRSHSAAVCFGYTCRRLIDISLLAGTSSCSHSRTRAPQSPLQHDLQGWNYMRLRLFGKEKV